MKRRLWNVKHGDRTGWIVSLGIGSRSAIVVSLISEDEIFRSVELSVDSGMVYSLTYVSHT